MKYITSYDRFKTKTVIAQMHGDDRAVVEYLGKFSDLLNLHKVKHDGVIYLIHGGQIKGDVYTLSEDLVYDLSKEEIAYTFARINEIEVATAYRLLERYEWDSGAAWSALNYSRGIEHDHLYGSIK